VLLVYEKARAQDGVALPAGQIVVHSHDGTTWLSIPTAADKAQMRQNLLTDRRLLRALAEVVYAAAPPEE